MNKNEQRYSINKLELLAVVWSQEYFKYYLFGSRFTLRTDHQALLSALKNHRGNKAYQKRLTRWVDRLLPFHFTVKHLAGKDMGFADYLSRQPNLQPGGENIDENHVINTIAALHYALHTSHRNLSNQIARKRTTYTDVINHSNLNKTKHNAFCHLHAIKQLPSFAVKKLNKAQLVQNHINQNSFITCPLFNLLISRTNPLFNPLLSRRIHITTKNNPELNTYTVPIKRRHRGPNKKKTQEQIMTIPQETNTIALQTEETSNLGQGG